MFMTVIDTINTDANGTCFGGEIWDKRADLGHKLHEHCSYDQTCN